MKKTLIALAAVAAMGAATAQVTLYGVADAALQQTSNSQGGVALGSTITGSNVGPALASGNLNGSRWGIKGTEDIGGGLGATFQLESGYNVDTGTSAQGGQLFGRQAYFGLTGGFGSLTLGRQYTPFDTLLGTYDAQGYTAYSAMSYAFNRGVGNDLGRQDNAIVYSTPAMSGFSAMVMIAPGENGTAVVSAGSHASGLVGYTSGPFSAHASYETLMGAATPAASNGTNTLAAPATATNAGCGTAAAIAALAPQTVTLANGICTTSAAPAVAATQTNTTAVGASYDLGAAKLFAIYETATRTIGAVTGNDNGYALGISIPLGATTIVASYAKETSAASATAVSGSSTAWALQGKYDLSKRTALYAAYLSGQSDATNDSTNFTSTTVGGVSRAGAQTVDTTVIAAGIRHSF